MQSSAHGSPTRVVVRAPFLISGYRDGIPVSTQSTYDAPGPIFGSFTLLVEVEDTSSGFDSDSITVDSSPTADSC